MAGDKIQGDNSGNILVEFDYNNIILVDPNKTISKGKVSERLVDHENMVMYANLEAELLPRTKLAVGISSSDIETISIAKINFLKPNKSNYFTTQYYEEFTGKDSVIGKGINQTKLENVPTTKGDNAYEKRTQTTFGEEDTLDTGLLGITSINVQISSSFVPSVKISLEDVQGRALFQLGDKSPYAAFFHIPYPPFYLTLKGYYGQAIKYMLNLTSFSARFNSFGGNYQIELAFEGFKFNILNEIKLAHLIALPHMYTTKFDISNSNTGEKPSESLQTTTQQQGGDIPKPNNTNTDITRQIYTSKGYQKLVEVYKEYKNIGILGKDFPELTFIQLMNKLELFEQTIIDYYKNKKTDVEPLTNIRNYISTLQTLYSDVYSGNDSWRIKNLEPKPFFGKDGKIYYQYKETISDSDKPLLLSKLDSIIVNAKELLDTNKTLGQGAPDEITNKIKTSIFTATTTPDKIDWKKTTEVQIGVSDANEVQINELISKYKKLFKPTTEGNIPDVVNSVVNAGSSPTPFANQVNKPPTIQNTPPYFFIFDGENRFIKVCNDMLSMANKKLSETEKKLTDELRKKIEDKNTGIGFSPTVRNIVAVIVASTEAFIRLLDDVHSKAWDVKYDDVRKKAILDNNSGPLNVETKGNVSNTIINSSNQTILKKPVYPWPHFFIETTDGNNTKYEVKYPGDPSVINKTEAYRYDKWPEVEFVEEFINGLATLNSQTKTESPLDVVEFTNLLNISAIQHPFTGLVYANKEEIKFFYEIWERQFLMSRYNNFVRCNSNNYENLIKTISDVDSKNIINTLGESNPFLNQKLKEFNFTAENYLTFLQNINGGTSRTWSDYFIKDKFVTGYISDIINLNLTNQLISLKNPGKISSTTFDKVGLKSLLTSTPNEPLIIDTYPFTDSDWSSKNLIDYTKTTGNEIYNISNTLSVNDDFNIISNFNEQNVFTVNRPVTNFSFYETQNPLVLSNYYSNDFFNDFYTKRTPNNFLITEGYCFFKTPKNINGVTLGQSFENVPYKTTTSILNTPYFINAIVEGIQLEKNSNPYPYVAAAYLFLNSLPLISLRERLKTKGKNLSDSDYMFASLKKYGALHKLPYAWILKIGSIWHRYKNVVNQNQQDILTNTIWTNLNYKNYYDPIGNNVAKQYVLDFGGKTGNTIQLESISQSVVSVQSGFYPKLINDFNYFYNGVELYDTYSDIEIQSSINNGLKIFNFSESNLSVTEVITPIQNPVTSTYKTWSVLTPTTDGYFVIPSFGSKINQVLPSLITNNSLITGQKFRENTSVYNGSARLLWAAPNYGYFDANQIVKPSYDTYLNNITKKADELSPFELIDQNLYSTIEELFGVFDKNTLDLFEENFLSFTKPMNTATNTPTTTSTFFVEISEDEISLRNFQALFRTLMKVDKPTDNETDSNYFEKINTLQLNNFSNVMRKFLEYDVIFKFGNPSFYDRYIFDSYLLHVSATTNTGESYLKYPQIFSKYQINSLPIQTPTNLEAFEALKLNVGFSTINNMNYNNVSSYLTDFFIVSDIEFTKENVEKLAPIIKIYATQKLKNPRLTLTEFKNDLSTFFDFCNQIQNDSLNQILFKVKKDLPNYSETPEKTIESKMQGEQTKFSIYDYFKALNDKWISGGDFKTKTFFEDFLFLDIASRDIGDKVFIDIFSLKVFINKSSLNVDRRVYELIASVLLKNKIKVMNLPAFTNFYNVQSNTGLGERKSEDSLEFADKMWGTFLTLDYRESGPKMICFYTGRPSVYASLPESKNFLYNSDGLTIGKDNTLGDSLKNKTDYARSNKIVGFNVDIGIRHQNIFSQFSVSQDAGKGTAENVSNLYDIIKKGSGREASTQNVSIYDQYLYRSYGCDVVSLGNAMLQPMMYFNLKHVPMFNGSYMITDVTHVVTPGSFETTFKGVRQSVYELPSLDDYLETINQNLLTQIEGIIKNQTQTQTNSTTNDSQNSASTTQNSETKPAAENSCKTTEKYTNKNYLPGTLQETKISLKNLFDTLKSATNPLLIQPQYKESMVNIIFTICYINCFKNDEFSSYNYNFARLETLDTYINLLQYGNFLPKTYTCVSVKTTSSEEKSIPILNFQTAELFVSFMVKRFNNVELVKDITERLGLHSYFITEWLNLNISQQSFEKNRDSVYKQSKKRIYDAVKELEKLGNKITDVEKFVNGKNYQTIYPTPTPSKPPLVVPQNASILRVENIQQGQTITKVSLSIFPNVGKWKISKVTYSVTSSARSCTPNLNGGTRNTDENWFLTPVEDINTSCNGSSTGIYNVIYDIVVEPVDNNGNSDPSRQTKFYRQTVTITI